MKRSLLGVVRVAGLRGAGALALLLLTWTVARTLELAESGRFLYMLSVVVVGAPVLVFGTNLASLRRIAILDGEGPDAAARMNGTVVAGVGIVLAGTCALGLPLVLAARFGGAFVPEDYLWLVNAAPMLLAVVIVTSLSILVGHQLQGLSRPTHSVVTLSLAGPLTFSALMAWRPEAYRDAADALELLLLSSSLALAYGTAVLLRLLRPARPVLTALAPFIAACAPIWVVAVCTVITNWGAQLLAVGWLSATDIALVNVAQRLAMSVSLVLIAVNLIVSPRIARLHAAGETAALQRLVSRAVLGIAALSLPALLVICLFPGPLLGLFGERYVAAAPYLFVFGIGQLVNVITGPSVQLLTMTGHEKVVMRIALASSAATLVTALVLLDPLGAIAVPIAAAVGIACQNLGAALRARRLVGVNVLRMRPG